MSGLPIDQACTLPGVSASVVLHHTAQTLLESVLASLRSEGIRPIYLVDNSPVPEHEDYGTQEDIVYLHVRNRGYGAGHNEAIRRAIDAGARYHLVVNPDVRWTGNVVKILVAYMDSRPDVAQTMPGTYYPDGTLQHTCRLLPTPLDMLCRRLIPSALCSKRMKRYLLPPEAYNHELNGPYLLGSFMLFRTAALKSEGLFDERFFMYPEDIDITRRLHRRWRTMLVPQVSIIHDHAAQSRTSLRMMRIHIVNMIRYFCKWGWWHDAERRSFNRDLLNQVNTLLNN